MFLAEDRIMCLEILTKKGERYLLKYVPGAKAVTDPPTDFKTLLKQRRRWTNGSLFATIYSILHID